MIDSSLLSGGSRIFPRGAPTPKSAIIFQFFAENCMKMKEFGLPGGAHIPGTPPWICQCCSRFADGNYPLSFNFYFIEVINIQSLQINLPVNYFLGSIQVFHEIGVFFSPYILLLCQIRLQKCFHQQTPLSVHITVLFSAQMHFLHGSCTESNQSPCS